LYPWQKSLGDQKMKKRRLLWFVGSAVVLVAVIASIAIPALTEQTQYETYEVTPTAVVKTVAANGQLAESQLLAYGPSEQPILVSANGSQAVPAQFGISLEINQIEVTEGQSVEEGDLLFSYNSQLGQSVEVTAIADGIVRSVDTSEGLRTSGQVVSVGSAVPVVSVFASEYDADLVDIGQKASIELDAINAVFEGDVISIGQVARSVSGIKQYEVLVEVTQIPTGARFGMSATAEIEVERSASVLAVPFSALIGELPEVQILVIGATGEQTVTTVEVKLGIRGDSLVEITSGLEAGDLVIIGLAGDVPSPVQFGPPPGAGNNG
jgi:multidrug efflux pump subunit AcrA (membrane-fusion protein)